MVVLSQPMTSIMTRLEVNQALFLNYLEQIIKVTISYVKVGN
jgi:hypothetical protein